MQNFRIVPSVLLIAAAVSGCGQSQNGKGSSDQDGKTKVAVSEMLPPTMVERASTVQLVMVTGSTDIDERPGDGNHYRRFDFEVLTSSGEPVPSLVVPINYGGMRPPGPPPTLPTELRFDSLQQGNRYWFLFGTDSDPQKYPFPVLAWWPADRAPQQVAELAKQDAYHWRPTYHKSSGLTFGFKTISPMRWEVIVKRGGELIWKQEVLGTAAGNETLSPLNVYEGANYEMVAIDSPQDKQPVYLIYAMSRSDLADDNRFGIGPGHYRLRSAWELTTGKRLAEWVLPVKHPDDPLAMRQYRYGDETLMLSAQFEFLLSGGIEAGASTEAWLRKLVRRHNEIGEVLETKVYRHGSVKDEQERHSHNGWILVQ